MTASEATTPSHEALPGVEALIAQLPDDAVIGAVDWNGYRVWVKRSRGADHWLSRVRTGLFMLLARYLGRGLPLSAPVADDGVCLEAARLRYYADLGLNVPRVLYAQADHFVIEDAGPGLRNELDATGVEHERAAILDEALDNLIDFHQRREWHGGAQLRNLTRKSGEVQRIDFEEPYAGRVALPLLQVLDLCLQLSSADRYSTAAHRQTMGRRWFLSVGSASVGMAAKRVLSLLYAIAAFPLLKLARYEHRRICAAIDALEGAIEGGVSRGLAKRPYRPAMPMRWRTVAVAFALMLAADDVLEFAMEYDDHPEEVIELLIPAEEREV